MLRMSLKYSAASKQKCLEGRSYHRYIKPRQPSSFTTQERQHDPPFLHHFDYSGTNFPNQKAISNISGGERRKLTEHPDTVAVGFFSFPEFQFSTRADYKSIEKVEKDSKKKKPTADDLKTFLCCHPVKMEPTVFDSSVEILSLFKTVLSHMPTMSEDSIYELFYKVHAYNKEIFPGLSSSQNSITRKFIESILNPCKALLKEVFKLSSRELPQKTIPWPIANENGEIVDKKTED